jgi:hypothetical protein
VLLEMYEEQQSSAAPPPPPARLYDTAVVPSMLNGDEYRIRAPAMPSFRSPETAAGMAFNADVVLHSYRLVCSKNRMRAVWGGLPVVARKSLAKKVAEVYYEAGIKTPAPFMAWRVDAIFYVQEEELRRKFPKRKFPPRKMPKFSAVVSTANIERKVATCHRLRRFEPPQPIFVLPPAAKEAYDHIIAVRKRLSDPNLGAPDADVDRQIVEELLSPELYKELQAKARRQADCTTATLRARFLKGEWLWT